MGHFRDYGVVSGGKTSLPGMREWRKPLRLPAVTWRVLIGVRGRGPMDVASHWLVSPQPRPLTSH